MGIINDIERLGLELDDEDRSHLKAIVDQLNKDQSDEFLRGPIIEGLMEEYLTLNRPEIMEALKRERTEQAISMMRAAARRYDEKGDRICDEADCSSTEDVSQCVYCGRFVCRDHNFGPGPCCCFACRKEQSQDSPGPG
jgi:hypothetical protein